MSDFQEEQPFYQYTIRCLVCAYTYTVGSLEEQPAFTNGDIQRLAQHNRGCHVLALNTPNALNITSDVSASKDVIALVYEIQVL